MNNKFMDLADALEVVLGLAKQKFNDNPNSYHGLALDTVEDFLGNNLEFEGELKYIVINAGTGELCTTKIFDSQQEAAESFNDPRIDSWVLTIRI